MTEEEQRAGASPGATDDDPPTQPIDLARLREKYRKRRQRHRQGTLSFRRKGQQAVQIPLDRASTLIGRDGGCDIVLDDPGVSRRHARVIKNEEGHFELVDAHSTNGILVEGVPTERMLLCDGDAFMIGETQFTIQINDA